MTTKAEAAGFTAPPDWIEAFKKQASLEGLTFSEWVAQACLQILKDRADGVAVVPEGTSSRSLGLSPRRGRGRPSTTGAPQVIPTPSDEQIQGWIGKDGRP